MPQGHTLFKDRSVSCWTLLICVVEWCFWIQSMRVLIYSWEKGSSGMLARLYILAR
jgi:hypothetical protein